MLRTDDDVYLFLAFQLHDGKVEGLAQVLRILQTGVNGSWTWAQWLNVSLPGEDPPRKIQRLYAGRLGEALRDARHAAWHAAWAWSS